MCVLFFGK